eukprot:7291716-Prymnesium_polylepis.2
MSARLAGAHASGTASALCTGRLAIIGTSCSRKASSPGCSILSGRISESSSRPSAKPPAAHAIAPCATSPSLQSALSTRLANSSELRSSPMPGSTPSDLSNATRAPPDASANTSTKPRCCQIFSPETRAAAIASGPRVSPLLKR